MNRIVMADDPSYTEQSSNHAEELIGVRLKDVRVQRGFNQDALAHKLGVSTSHLCNVETGRKKPSFEMLVALAASLDISLDYLVLGRAKMEKMADSRMIFRSDDEFRAMKRDEK